MVAIANRLAKARTERKVTVKAVKRGTINHKTGIYHFDPNGKREEARKRAIPQSAAIAAQDKGLVKILKSPARQSSEPRGPSISSRGVERRAENAEGAESGEPFTGGGDTRDTTAFPQDTDTIGLANTNEGLNNNAVDQGDVEGEDEDEEGAEDEEEEEGDATGGDGPPIESSGGGDDGSEGGGSRRRPAAKHKAVSGNRRPNDDSEPGDTE